MKLIIAGSRTYRNYPGLWRIIGDAGLRDSMTEIVSGGCRGVDQLGEQYAADFGIPLKRFLADWKKHGQKAGPLRNEKMAKYADALLAIRNTKSSRGTDDMIRRAQAHGLDVHIFQYEADALPEPPRAT